MQRGERGRHRERGGEMERERERGIRKVAVSQADRFHCNMVCCVPIYMWYMFPYVFRFNDARGAMSGTSIIVHLS